MKSTIHSTRQSRNPQAAMPAWGWMLALVAAVGMTLPANGVVSIDLGTATVAELQKAMESGGLTAEKLVQLYLARIEAYDQKGPKLNTVLTLNAKALEEARALDAERRLKGPRSPLHGMVILAKDVFDTKDMPTSGGFKPMATSQPSRDAFVIERLRAAGAIILAKLNQSDWYGVAAPGGSTWKGPVVSPYNPKKYGGGSSSGTGASMAAWFGTVGLGSDTSGSIVNPSAHGNLVGFAMTEGLISRRGMMWSSPGQEKGGPMGRSVYDCAAVLDAIAGYDPSDLITEASIGKMPDRPYTSFVDPKGLQGARVGVLREMFRSGPIHSEGLALAEKALADMKAAGAVVVDPVTTGLNLVETQNDGGEAKYSRAMAIDAYLAGLPADAPIRSVEEMIAKGGSMVKPVIIETAKIKSLDRHAGFAAIKEHQEMLKAALVGLMDKHRLDCLVLPYRTALPQDYTTDIRVNGSSGVSNDTRNTLHSFTGLPTIIMPGGFFPSDGMPFGMQVIGRPFSEPTLIKVASGYEAVTQHRKAPALTPPLPGETLTLDLLTSTR
jgi:amidase